MLSPCHQQSNGKAAQVKILYVEVITYPISSNVNIDHNSDTISLFLRIVNLVNIYPFMVERLHRPNVNFVNVYVSAYGTAPMPYFNQCLWMLMSSLKTGKC